MINVVACLEWEKRASDPWWNPRVAEGWVRGRRGLWYNIFNISVVRYSSDLFVHPAFWFFIFLLLLSFAWLFISSLFNFEAQNFDRISLFLLYLCFISRQYNVYAFTTLYAKKDGGGTSQIIRLQMMLSNVSRPSRLYTTIPNWRLYEAACPERFG